MSANDVKDFFFAFKLDQVGSRVAPAFEGEHITSDAYTELGAECIKDAGFLVSIAQKTLLQAQNF